MSIELITVFKEAFSIRGYNNYSSGLPIFILPLGTSPLRGFFCYIGMKTT
jgi:hypothetical protein